MKQISNTVLTECTFLCYARTYSYAPLQAGSLDAILYPKMSFFTICILTPLFPDPPVGGKKWKRSWLMLCVFQLYHRWGSCATESSTRALETSDWVPSSRARFSKASKWTAAQRQGVVCSSEYPFAAHLAIGLLNSYFASRTWRWGFRRNRWGWNKSKPWILWRSVSFR